MAATERRLIALCDVVELALAETVRMGALTDDRPELALSAVRAWSRGELSDDAIDESAEDMHVALAAAWKTPAEPLCACVDWLCLAAQDGERVDVDDEIEQYVLVNAERALVNAGEREDAAGERVRSVYRDALARQRKRKRPSSR